MKPTYRHAVAALGLCVCAAACSATSPAAERPRHPGGAPIADLAARLVQQAELRADLRSIRIYVDEVHRTGSSLPLAVALPVRVGDDDLAAEEIRREFVFALSERFNLVASDLVEQPDRDDLAPQKRASELGATHLFVGDYVHRNDDILLTLRLVDAESLLIVAAARGTFPVGHLSNRAQEQLRLEGRIPLMNERPARRPGGDVTKNAGRSVLAATSDLEAPGPQAAVPLPARSDVEDFQSWSARKQLEQTTGEVPRDYWRKYTHNGGRAGRTEPEQNPPGRR